ncbi:hypothetical protein EMIT0P294_240020 [Pseudomonas sp. IT-P294]
MTGDQYFLRLNDGNSLSYVNNASVSEALAVRHKTHTVESDYSQGAFSPLKERLDVQIPLTDCRCYKPCTGLWFDCCTG